MTLSTSDENWVDRLKSGSESERDEAIAELRDLILRGLSRSLNNHYGNRSFNVEDVVQEALIKIMDAIDTFEGRSRFTTWAITIATRVGISALRRKHFQDVSLDGITAGDSLKIELAVTEEIPSGQVMDQRTILSQLQTLIDDVLTEKQKFAIRGLLEGLPIEEIASRTGSNRNAIYKLVHDARTRLKEGFEQSGIVAEDINAIFT